MSLSIYFCVASLALLCSSSATNDKRWPTFIRDSVSSITNTVNGIKIPLQFFMMSSEKERKLANAATSEQQKGSGSQRSTCESKVKTLEELVGTQEASLAALRSEVRGLEAKIRSLKEWFAAYGLASGDELDGAQIGELQISTALTNYTIHDRCTYKNSSLVIAMVTGKQLVPKTCGTSCNRMRNCGGFQFFHGYNGTQLRGCFYLHDSLTNRDLLCAEKIDQSMPERFAIFLKS